MCEKKMKKEGKENAKKTIRKVDPVINQMESGEESTEVNEIPEEEKPNLKIISREQWAAENARSEMRNFPKLPELVRVCSTGTPTCDGFVDCCAAVQHIQIRDFQERIPDIKYNFIVSSDGLVFEGRSWKVIPHIRGQKYRSRCLLFGIIGEFLDFMPPKYSLRSIGTLLSNAVKENHVNRHFKILPFQTFKMPIDERPKGPKVSFSEFEDSLSEWELFKSERPVESEKRAKS